MTTPTAESVAIIEVRGGVAEVTCGYAVIVDWDNIPDDIGAAESTLESLEGVGGSDAKRIRDFIREVWPELTQNDSSGAGS